MSDARAQLTEVEAEHSELRRDIAGLQEELAQRQSQEEFLGAIAKWKMWKLLSTRFLWDVQHIRRAFFGKRGGSKPSVGSDLARSEV